MSVISVVGARPNFIKMAPVIQELKKMELIVYWFTLVSITIKICLIHFLMI